MPIDSLKKNDKPNMVRKIGILGMAFLTITLGVQAQEIDEIDYYLQKYKGENLVNSLVKTHITIGYDDKDELKITIDEAEKRVYLNDNAAHFSKESITFSEHEEVNFIEVFSLLPNKGKFKKVKVDDFARKTEFSSGIFSNGTESLNFFYPSLSKGAISSLSYSTQLKRLNYYQPYS